MAHVPGPSQENHSLQFVSAIYGATLQTTLSAYRPLQTIPQNVTIYDRWCDDVPFSEIEHLPLEKPEGILTEDVEFMIRRIKDILLAFLFLIGAPGNIINTIVFYKQGLKDRVNLCLFTLSLTDEFHLIMGILHHGEQLYLQFTTRDLFGPVDTFLTNYNSLGLFGFNYISYILSAIIATERCLCILNPLKFQTLLRTKTMAIIITVAYILILGLCFITTFRYRVGCVYDPAINTIIKTGVSGTFYKAHKDFIDNLESFVFGVGLPGTVMIVVITATRITTVKLREVVTWRAGSSSEISPREVALTKMLVANSILFLVCLFPVAVVRFSWLFLPGMTTGTSNMNFLLSTFWIAEFFTYVNSSLNIFVYYVMGSRYRETFWALFGRKPAQKEQERNT
ncbi:formyl peptide receptor-related sequence 6-like [Babylonia areolata]|uniref:formyl peptide receptor-related sequence 6-like n=1 Tax=Babylonia areolata TaxID=304850 RepID=UPI003FCF6E77